MGLFDSVGSFLRDTVGEIFKPENVAGALIPIGKEVFGQSAAKEQSQWLAGREQAKYDAERELLGLKHQHEMALLQAKAALAGGGGGGGGSSVAAQLAHAKRLARFEAMQGANANQIDSHIGSSNQVLQAYRNLIDAAQRPIR